jgi:hypothetical protein
VPTLYTPFPDVAVDPRSAQQLPADATAVSNQISYFSQPRTAQWRDQFLAGLVGRRSGDTSGQVVQFQLIPNLDGSRTLVVSGEVLFDLRSGPPIGVDVSPISSPVFNRVPLRLAATSDSGLATRVGRLVTASGSAALVEQAIADVANTYAAAHNGVSVFQQNPGPVSHDVVVKLEKGPSPTSVQDGVLPAPAASDGARVAVIDTGISSTSRTDGRLQGLENANDGDPLNVFPLPNADQYLDVAAGHGTFAAGIIQMIDPHAHITVYRALDSDGFTSEDALASALVQAVTAGAQVVNLSCGVRNGDDSVPIALRAAIEEINDMFAMSVEQRPVIVAAAGNFGDTVRVYPAAFSEVVSVAALTPAGAPAAWSSHGAWVDLSAIGEGVVAPYVVGTQDPTFSDQDPPPATAVQFEGPNPWAVWTGTSFAAPQVTGAVSRTMREQQLSAQEALAQLAAAATNVGGGWGKGLRLLPGTAT